MATDNPVQLFVPDRIKVGYQNRKDTYTGHLAYVTYFDKKGTLRKEKSWNGWRDKKIEPQEFKNEPIEGFVLNKQVGGRRQSYSYNPRNEYVRVFDPRGFEFEISVPNLLFILRECDCSKGKGLEGEFVYSWHRADLVLLPVSSHNYKVAQEFSDLQGKTVVSAKSLKKGATYTTKKNESFIYIGHYRVYHNGPVHHDGELDEFKAEKPRKKHVFWNLGKKNFEFLGGMTSLACCADETAIDNYADLVDKFEQSRYGSPIAKLELAVATKKMTQDSERYVFVAPYDDGLYFYRPCESGEYPYWQIKHRIALKDGCLLHCRNKRNEQLFAFPPDVSKSFKDRVFWRRFSREMPWLGKNHFLVATLESGSRFYFTRFWRLEPYVPTKHTPIATDLQYQVTTQ